MSSFTTAAASITTVAANTVKPRLIDQDGNKHIKIKQIIVVGDITPHSIAVGHALRQLGFDVYDINGTFDVHKMTRWCNEARARKEVTIDNRERDWPLWIEAVQAKLTGEPYEQAEFDKLTGLYNVIGAGPASAFTNDLIKAYPSAKVIVTNTSTPSIRFIQTIALNILAYVDTTGLYGHISVFTKIAPKIIEPVNLNVPEKQLLKLNHLDSWNELCAFVGKSVPTDKPIPIARGLSSKLNAHTMEVFWAFMSRLAIVLQYILMAACVGRAVYLISRRYVRLSFAAIADYISAWTFLAITYFKKPPSAVEKLPPRSSAFMTFKITEPLPATTKPPAVTPQSNAPSKPRTNNKKTRGGKRVWSPPVARSPRPARPIVSAWSNFGDHIAADDAARRQEAEARLAAEGNNPNVIEHKYVYHGRESKE